MGLWDSYLYYSQFVIWQVMVKVMKFFVVLAFLFVLKGSFRPIIPDKYFHNRPA